MTVRPALRPWLSRVVLCASLLAGGTAWAELPVLSNGPAWIELEPVHRQALQPLQKDWVNFDPASKRKWMDVAKLFPRMSPEERARVQQRMREWAAMTPAQRRQARILFQDTKTLSAGDELPQRWQQYQELSPEQRSELAERAVQRKALAAASRKRSGSAPVPAAPGTAPATNTSPPLARAALLLSTPAPRPGATTTVVPMQAAVPLHQQSGLPKIVATPDFVDPHTLLPRRGPQGAAMLDRATRLADR
jgi:Protein of unknown function (DUF3106)